MNAEDLKTKTEDELVKIILDLRKEQFNSRFQQTQGTLENTATIRKARRTIARAKTILNQKRRGDVAPATAKAEAKKAKPAAKKTKAA
ncbi:MAG: 50S ribosomal protein L29 [Alphaproteobacteria bacterium]|nr:50S ribosomal protein L29 [Alphaproteobacteria bacterium]